MLENDEGLYHLYLPTLLFISHWWSDSYLAGKIDGVRSWLFSYPVGTNWRVHLHILGPTLEAMNWWLYCIPRVVPCVRPSPIDDGRTSWLGSSCSRHQPLPPPDGSRSEEQRYNIWDFLLFPQLSITQRYNIWDFFLLLFPELSITCWMSRGQLAIPLSA